MFVGTECVIFLEPQVDESRIPSSFFPRPVQKRERERERGGCRRVVTETREFRGGGGMGDGARVIPLISGSAELFGG